MMKFILALAIVLLASIAEAACPAGSTCEDYNGTIPYVATNPTGTATRTPADRQNDRGVNILEFGAIGNGSADDTANIQHAIDVCFTMANKSCTTVLCGGAASNRFNISYPLFLDPPNNLRGWDTIVTGNNSTIANGSTAVTLGAPVAMPGLYPGMLVSGTGIPNNTLVVATNTGIGGVSVTLSQTATANSSTTQLTFTGAWDSAQSYQIGMVAKINGVPWQSLNAMSGISIISGGTGWVVNDKFVLWASNWEPSGGGPFLQSALAHVTTVSGGVITGIAIDSGGAYYSASTSYAAIPLPGSVGTGASFGTPVFAVNTNNTPSVTSTHWRAVTMGTLGNRVNQSYAVSLVGPESLPDGNFQGHCTITPQYNSAPAIWTTGNGVLIKNVNILFPQGGGYNCQLPTQGIGFAITGQGTRTKVENSQSSGSYYGYAVGADGNGGLGDSNSMEKSQIGGACIAAAYLSTQAFVNDIHESNLSGNTVVWSYSGTGVNVVGGNMSSTGWNGSEASPGATFTINSSTTAIPGNSIELTAVVNLTPSSSAPVPPGSIDAYLNNARCNQQEPDFPRSCVYNAFVINDPKFGPIPLDLVGFINNANGTATMRFSVSTLFQAPLDNNYPQSSIATSLGTATTMYASEVSTAFGGCGISAKQFHLENLEVPTTLIDSKCGFGNRANDISNPYINYDPTLWTAYTSVNAYIAQFMAQSVSPFIRLRGTHLHISDMTSQLGGTFGGERLLVDGTSGSSAIFKWTGQAPLLSARGSNLSVSSQSFSHGTYPLNSPGLGVGQFDETAGASAWVSYSSQVAGSANQVDDWTVLSMGKTPFMGWRPAPYTTPCLTPAQLTILNQSAGDLLSNNPITHTGAGLATVYAVPYPSMWGGIAYRACSWDAPSFTFNAATRDGGSLFVSSHKFYTYGQDLTTMNVPNLTWTHYRSSPVIFANVELLSLLRPGLGFSLTCNAMTFEGIVTDVHPTEIFGPSSNQGFFRYQNAVDTAGGPYVFDFGTDCVGQTTNFKQAAFSIAVH